MAIGFDYGTTKCSVAHINDGKVQAVALESGEYFIPSTLCAPNRESVTEFLYRHRDIKPSTAAGEALLRGALNKNQQLGIEVGSKDIKFGQQATALYLEDPTESYYVKSPKSFLGLLGLQATQLAVFEDLVCAMMVNVREQSEQQLQRAVKQAVIGIPINFHNKGGERSNRQAKEILTNAAKRAGFKDIEFLFEPVAAGLEFESTLTEEQLVLVVDIGGGTTDCSMLKMGPQWLAKEDRSESMVGHLGSFVGGNDLDIAISFKRFMREFGRGSENEAGRPLPSMLYWQAVAINDVIAQREFYAHDNLNELKQLVSTAQSPEKVQRLLQLYKNTLSHAVVHNAELAKIALASHSSHTSILDLLNEQLSIDIDVAQMQEAISTPLNKIINVITDTVKQAGRNPDTVYITGGSSRSPLIRQTIQTILPDTPIASGDFDASVTSGLARRAAFCFA